MRLTWLSDIHLNFLDDKGRENFAALVAEETPDAIVIGGDIGEADNVGAYLTELADFLQKDTYFVLGNHDYYRGSVAGVRSYISRIAREHKYLHWLPDCGVVELTSKTALVGHGGWADGRFGDWHNSNMLLNDYFVIDDLRDIQSLRLETMRRLAAEAADFVDRIIPKALASYEQVFFVTHVPPFKEVCLYMGKASDDNALPHYASKIIGQALRRAAKAHPESRLTVLCGHTHCGGEVAIAENLTVFAGWAEYGHPDIQQTFEIQ